MAQGTLFNTLWWPKWKENSKRGHTHIYIGVDIYIIQISTHIYTYVCVCVCVTDSLCCTIEINTTS